MAARSTARPQSQAAQRQRHIIKHHENLGWRDLVKLRYRQERVATAVHVARWFDQKHFLRIWPINASHFVDFCQVDPHCAAS